MKLFGNMFRSGALMCVIFVLGTLGAKPGFAASPNLIVNPDLEIQNVTSPQNWQAGVWGNNATQFTYPVAGHVSTRAAKVSMTAYTDGDAKWYFSDVPVSPLTEYIFSDWYQSDIASTVIMRYLISDGSYQYAFVASVPASAAWTQMQATVSTPSGVVSATALHVISSVGQLTIDDASLSVTPPPSAQFTEGMVTFSFDDGFKSTFTAGIPILDRAGIKSTQAIITKYFAEPGYVTAADVKAMAASGHEIASHTQTHPDLTTLSTRAARREINQSKADLAAIGVTVSTIVYPYGTYNDAVIGQVKNAGYIGARSVDDGFNSPLANRYALRDQHITSDVTWPVIKSWIDKAVTDKQWVILEMHRQDVNGGLYANDPALLQQMVDYVKTQKIKTVTLGQGIGLLK